MWLRPPLARAEIIPILAAFALAGCVAAGAVLASPPEFLPGSDWPSYRHDAGLTGVTPLKGGLGQPPRIAWSIDLGGPRIPSESIQVRDVTGDGLLEILIVGSDTLECRRAMGQRLWRLEGYPSTSVVDVRDYAGDGGRGILVTTTVG